MHRLKPDHAIWMILVEIWKSLHTKYRAGKSQRESHEETFLYGNIRRLLLVLKYNKMNHIFQCSIHVEFKFEKLTAVFVLTLYWDRIYLSSLQGPLRSLYRSDLNHQMRNPLFKVLALHLKLMTSHYFPGLFSTAPLYFDISTHLGRFILNCPVQQTSFQKYTNEVDI